MRLDGKTRAAAVLRYCASLNEGWFSEIHVSGKHLHVFFISAFDRRPDVDNTNTTIFGFAGARLGQVFGQFKAGSGSLPAVAVVALHIESPPTRRCMVRKSSLLSVTIVLN